MELQFRSFIKNIFGKIKYVILFDNVTHKKMRYIFITNKFVTYFNVYIHNVTR